MFQQTHWAQRTFILTIKIIYYIFEYWIECKQIAMFMSSKGTIYLLSQQVMNICNSI